jgi:hypothetical protein
MCSPESWLSSSTTSPEEPVFVGVNMRIVGPREPHLGEGPALANDSHKRKALLHNDGAHWTFNDVDVVDVAVTHLAALPRPSAPQGSDPRRHLWPCRDVLDHGLEVER